MRLLKNRRAEASGLRAFTYGHCDKPVGDLAAPQERTALLSEQSCPAAEPSPTDLLKAQIEQLTVRLKEAETSCAQARMDGLAEGRVLEREEMQSREADRLEVLATSLNKASTNLLERIAKERDLAIEIARAIIAHILGDISSYRETVAATACAWAERITASTVLCLRISETDFPDEAALAALQSRIGALTIVRDRSLEQGACVFDLKLGQLDASIPLQARKADSMLAGHSAAVEVNR